MDQHSMEERKWGGHHLEADLTLSLSSTLLVPLEQPYVPFCTSLPFFGELL